MQQIQGFYRKENIPSILPIGGNGHTWMRDERQKRDNGSPMKLNS